MISMRTRSGGGDDDDAMDDEHQPSALENGCFGKCQISDGFNGTRATSQTNVESVRRGRVS
jgi:hypothetical protein